MFNCLIYFCFIILIIKRISIMFVDHTTEHELLCIYI